MKKRKCIVQIVRAPSGGIRKHILDIIVGCPQFDFILITNLDDADPVFKEFYKNPSKNLKLITHCNIIDKPSLKDISNLVYIYKELKKYNIDIIHGHGAKGGLYARLLRPLVGAQIFYTAHGGSMHSMHGKIKNTVYRYVEKVLYYLTNTLVFESQHSMLEYENKVHSSSEKFVLNCNSVAIPENFDRLKAKPISKSHPIIIGAFGLLRHIKGHDILIEAMKEVIHIIPSVQLKIYGDGEKKLELNKLITKLHLENSIVILPFKKQIDLAMQECHIIAHPSRFESFGYVPLEATINGVPVVSSLEGGLKEVIDNGNAGFAVSPLNPKNMAKMLIESIENKELREKYFDNAKKLVLSKFSNERFINVIANLYER